MQNEVQIALNHDKTFTKFLWMLGIDSVLYVYLFTPFFLQIPFSKGVAGLLMMVTEILLVVMAIRTYRDYYSSLTIATRWIVLLIIFYNVLHILYATFITPDIPYLSLFGNQRYQPLFLLPIALMLGLESERFFPLHKCLWYYIILTLPVLLFTSDWVPVGVCIFPLLAFAKYLPKSKQRILIIVAIVYILFCYFQDARAALVRTLMGGAIWLFSLTSVYKSKIVKVLIFVVITILPLYYLRLFVKTDYSVFDQSIVSSYVSEYDDEHGGTLSADTRTALYTELFEDLTDNKAWVFGKGIAGKYYSRSFDSKDSEGFENRFSIEVGLLVFLLKGGLVQTILYMLILLIAIYRCVVRSNNMHSMLLGLVLLSHYFLLFVEEIPRYDLYHVAMWMYTGLAFTMIDMDEDVFEDKFSLLFPKR